MNISKCIPYDVRNPLHRSEIFEEALLKPQDISQSELARYRREPKPDGTDCATEPNFLCEVLEVTTLILRKSF